MNYDPRFAAVCGDSRLPSNTFARLVHRRQSPQAQLVPSDRDAPILSDLHGATSTPGNAQQRRMPGAWAARQVCGGGRSGDGKETD